MRSGSGQGTSSSVLLPNPPEKPFRLNGCEIPVAMVSSYTQHVACPCKTSGSSTPGPKTLSTNTETHAFSGQDSAYSLSRGLGFRELG